MNTKSLQLIKCWGSVINMRSLALSVNKVFIPHIPPKLLAQALTKLETFLVFGGRITAAQISAVFTGLSAVKDHKLKTLGFNNDLSGTDLSSIPTDILVAGISGLEKVSLRFSALSTEQLTGIYRMVADRRCSRMRQIDLGGNNLRSVSQDLRDRAKLNQSVNIMVD